MRWMMRPMQTRRWTLTKPGRDSEKICASGGSHIEERMVDKMNNAEFFEALKLLEKEKGIDGEYLLEKSAPLSLSPSKRDYGGKGQYRCHHGSRHPGIPGFPSQNRGGASGRSRCGNAAGRSRAVFQKATVGDTVEIPLETKQFGRIAAQTAKHVIRQGIREAERGQQMQEFQRRNQELVTALVTRVDAKNGAATLEIGKAEAVLPKSEQIGEEELREGDRVKVYVVDVREGEKGPRVLISRTHPGLVKRLFEMEVPEIFNGVVEIKAVSREAGSRTKLAVLSHDENVDAVGPASVRKVPGWAHRGRTRRREDRYRGIRATIRRRLSPPPLPPPRC